MRERFGWRTKQSFGEMQSLAELKSEVRNGSTNLR